KTSAVTFNKIAFAVLLLSMNLVIYYFFTHIEGMMTIGGKNFFYNMMAPLNYQQLNLVIGALCLNVFLIGSFFYLVNYDIKQNIIHLLRSINYFWFIVYASFFILMKYYCSFFPEYTGSSFRNYFLGSYTSSCVQPFIDIVAH